MNQTSILQTDSIQELADFWDTHDLTNFEDELEEATELGVCKVFGIKHFFFCRSDLRSRPEVTPTEAVEHVNKQLTTYLHTRLNYGEI